MHLGKALSFHFFNPTMKARQWPLASALERRIRRYSSVTISSYDAELQIDGFEYLKENFPTGLTEFLEYMARVGEQSVILCRCGYEA
ncbi:hypothetical protein CMV_022903 [Castanea mollissima]|uniref:Uncharacterized protein n=1 Tax=Castanea mollissima TaxID=60419 RepID=A0A8J4QH40_9ROSI|nr:hypothetical protein CMV_022903 [Castanea mollissima]